MRTPKGITLIELVIYIGVLVLILGGMTIFLIQTVRIQGATLPAIEMNTANSQIMWQLRHEIAEATSFNETASTLESSPSTLVLVDGSGQTVTIDRIADGGVDRLRLTRDSQSYWITGTSVDVTGWLAESVVDSLGVTTGIRLTVNMEITGNSNDAYRQNASQESTTLWLRPQTTVL